MKDIINNYFFWFGLFLKVSIIILVTPYLTNTYYGPFILNSFNDFSFDPWSSWLNFSGDILAFPYGYAMWIVLLPLYFIGSIFSLSVEYSYALTLLICDFAVLVILCKILIGRSKLVLFSYWLSPVVILATYALGVNDIIPVLFLMISIYFLRLRKLRLSGIFFAIAVSAKISMLLILPFIFLYLFKNKPLRELIKDFLIGFIAVFILLGIPFLLSNAGMSMVFKNPNISNTLSLSLEISESSKIYLLQILFGIVCYFVWKVRRLNFDLFMAINGVAFLSLVILTPSASGWFIWSIPFLIFYQALSGRGSVLMFTIFSGLFVASIALKEKFYFFNGSVIDLRFLTNNLSFFTHQQLLEVLDTCIFTIGIVLALRMWREAINENDFFRISKKPFVIGIAGDSGAGKDTFSDSISGLFGDHSTVKLSGDDYHLWDRHKPMWQVMTHLNPMSNDLEAFSRDLSYLSDGKEISARFYDHETGKMSKFIKIKSNDFIFASGLHALYLPQLRDCYNLMIYLDMNENLRRHFKIKRDVEIRGHSLAKVLEALQSREADSKKFIKSQRDYADLILSVQPIHEEIIDYDDHIDRQLKVVATTNNGLSELTLNRVLVGLCGLHVDMAVSNNGAGVTLTIEGDTSKEDIELAAKILCPNIFEFFDINPKWHNGVMGIMQLVTLFHINQVLTNRFIK